MNWWKANHFAANWWGANWFSGSEVAVTTGSGYADLPKELTWRARLDPNVRLSEAEVAMLVGILDDEAVTI